MHELSQSTKTLLLKVSHYPDGIKYLEEQSPQINRSMVAPKEPKITKDYDFLKVIGTGSFGKVYLARSKEDLDKSISDQNLFAVKVLTKSNIVDKKQKDHVTTERNVMSKIDHPFIVKMHRAFQSDTKLYFVLDFLNGGELHFHMKKEGRFTENKTRFYASEVILAVEHLHKKGIIYRDLKPENILVNQDGHIKLTDFGLSKTGIMGSNQAFTF